MSGIYDKVRQRLDKHGFLSQSTEKLVAAVDLRKPTTEAEWDVQFVLSGELEGRFTAQAKTLDTDEIVSFLEYSDSLCLRRPCSVMAQANGYREVLVSRCSVQAEAMDSAALVEALAPIADMRRSYGHVKEFQQATYADVLIRRHPEARAAADAWGDDTDEDSPEFEAGPVVPVVEAVRAVLGR